MSRRQEIPMAFYPAQPLFRLLPGLALTGGIVAIAYAIRSATGILVFSPLVLSILLGIAFQNLIGTPVSACPGTTFAMKRVLRFAIVLLGLQLTVTQIGEVGLSGIAIIGICTVSTFLVTRKAGVWMGVEPKLAELIAAGTSICGASAVIATNTVTRACDEDVAYSIACVTIFGSVAVFAYPLLTIPLDLSPHEFGLWSGASIHEIAQVIASAYQDGQASGEFGTIAKLTRVLLLAPMVLTLGAIAHRKACRPGAGEQTAFPWPWFVLGFAAMVSINSLVAIPPSIKTETATLTTALLSMALAAMGLGTDIRKLKMKGIRPLALGLVSFLFIAVLSLILIKVG